MPVNRLGRNECVPRVARTPPQSHLSFFNCAGGLAFKPRWCNLIWLFRASYSSTSTGQRWGFGTGTGLGSGKPAAGDQEEIRTPAHAQTKAGLR
ncbi:uncharacterized protein VTP21DRAFT_4667 [Calcarisporiella thermophila]|uniref:uncharacterized protein n=1 Tax=Calcarisporiella thermophila TaxID=911321 RepID=UPI00374229FD